MEIQFGAIAPKLAEQLDGCGINEQQLHFYDRLADAITLLRIQSLIPASAADAARKKLLKRIAQSAPAQEQSHD